MSQLLRVNGHRGVVLGTCPLCQRKVHALDSSVVTFVQLDSGSWEARFQHRRCRPASTS